MFVMSFVFVLKLLTRRNKMSKFYTEGVVKEISVKEGELVAFLLEPVGIILRVSLKETVLGVERLPRIGV